MNNQAYKYLIAKAYELARSPSRNFYAFGTAVKKGLSSDANQLKIDELSNKYLLRGSKGFSAGSFERYLKQLFLNDNWNCLDNSIYTHYLAIFCGKDDFDDFYKNDGEWLSKLDADKLIASLKAIANKAVRNEVATETLNGQNHIIGAEYFKTIELGLDKYRVNCITFSLHWAKEYILKNKEAVQANANEYRYILLERNAIAVLRPFAKFLRTDPSMEKRFKFRAFWESQVPNHFFCDPIQFPIFNDLVLYEKFNSETNDFDFHKAIVGVIPIHGIPANENFSVLIPDDRGNALFQWFDNAWDNLKDVRIEQLVGNG